MHRVFRRLAESDPQHGLWIHKDFYSEGAFYSYASFPQRIAAYAEAFRVAGISEGTRIVFPFETSEEAIFSFLSLIALGAIPLSVKPYILSTPREPYCKFLERVAQQCGARDVLAMPSLEGLELPLRRIPLPPAGTRADAGLRFDMLTRNELAFVQFSSGSTSFPKGVPISHRNLVANLEMIVAHDQRQPKDQGLAWLPLYHDMGLVGGLLTNFLMANDIHVMQPLDFLMDPLGWLRFISDRKITISVIPNFAIDYSLKSLRAAESSDLQGLDFSPFRRTYLGSEPINLQNLREFYSRLGPYGLKQTVFMPCYGMAEAVLMVSAVKMDEEATVVTAPNGLPAISVGCPLKQFDVRLRTEDGHLCKEGELGEFELRQGTLAGEYFADPRPFYNADGYYATGDLGFIHNGELFITGRISDRIKLNGQSYFSNDFEQAIEALPFIRPGRTVVLQIQDRVVVLSEVKRFSAFTRLAQHRQQVSATLLAAIGVKVPPEDVHFIRYNQIEKTSSGKLRRKAMSESFAAGRIRSSSTLGLAVDLFQQGIRRVFVSATLFARSARR
jgi:acyl-CoA synthetase (AMP-forming)/AMP-acid ligase II